MSTVGQAALWQDWCAAVGHDPDTVSVPALTRHLTDCPARTRRARRERVKAILTVAASDEQTRAAVLPPVPQPQTAIRGGERWLSVDETLASLDPYGWPAGVVARRDAWLVTLLGRLRMSRREALAVTPRDVDVPHAGAGGWPVVRGLDMPFDADPTLCGACVAVRWLRVLAADADGGRRGVEGEIAQDSTRGHGHRCGDETPPSWRSAPTLAPAIDRHGWLGPVLSRRSVTAILADRQRRLAAFPPEQNMPPQGDRVSHTMGTRPAPDTMIDDALDRLDAALEVALGKVTGVLDVAEGSLPGGR